MHIPKKYFQDRMVLLLLSVNAFITLLSSILILLRLDNGRSDGYIIQYRSNLGLSAYKAGAATTFIAFILFSILVLVFHTVLSMRVYHVRRHFAVAVLGMGLLLLVLGLIVSNALLVLR
jgi:cytochrome c biogenesis protein CcdA